MGIQALKEKMAELQKEIKATGESELKNEFSEFFKANPQIEAIRWTQYTPYFNDGDPCVFGIHGTYFKKANRAEDYEGEGDGFDYASSYEDDADGKLVDKFFDSISDDQIFEIAFGDGVQVTATADAIEISEYEHD